MLVLLLRFLTVEPITDQLSLRKDISQMISEQIDWLVSVCRGNWLLMG